MNIPDMSNNFLSEQIKTAVKIQMNDEITDIKFIGGGSYGKVYKVNLKSGNVIAVKAYRIPGSEARESKQLEALSKSTSVKMPEIFFTHSDEKASLTAMSFVEGQNVLNPAFLLKSKARKMAFADAVVDGLREIHSVKGEKYGDILNPVYTSWLEYFRKEKIEPGLAGLSDLCKTGKYGKKNYERLCAATEIFYKIADEPENPVLIHGDINIMNIMADPKTMALTGFIDPGLVAWADREYELFQLRNMWGDSFGLYETYKSRCKTSEYCDFKVAYYGALNEASMRLGGGLTVPVWEILCNRNLDIAMRNLSVK